MLLTIEICHNTSRVSLELETDLEVKSLHKECSKVLNNCSELFLLTL